MNVNDNVANDTLDSIPIKFRSIFDPMQDYIIGTVMLIIGK